MLKVNMAHNILASKIRRGPKVYGLCQQLLAIMLMLDKYKTVNETHFSSKTGAQSSTS